MKSVFEVLKERGLIAQMTHEEEIKELLENKKITFYIGFDPTADSLHKRKPRQSGAPRFRFGDIRHVADTCGRRFFRKP